MRLTLAPATVTARDTDSRRMTGVAVPYGTPGRTSAGTVTVRAGALELPDPLGRCKLLYGHDRDRPVGAAVDATDSPEHLALTFAITRNADGDTLLAELDPDAPARDGLSVELDDVTLDGDEVTAGRVVAVAAVPLPAFTEARAALAAGDTPQEDPPMPDTPDTVAGDTTVVSADAPAAPLMASTRRSKDDPLEVLASSIRAGMKPADIEAALSDLADASPSVQPQWVGKLWQNVNSRRRFIEAVTNRPLTSQWVTGWKWTAGLDVDTWAGGKSAIPSNVPTLEAVQVTAQYLAGGVDVAREWVDLGSREVLTDLVESAIVDYRVKSESAAVTAALAGATAVPANADGIGRFVDVVMALVSTGADLSFVFAGKTAYKDLITSAQGFDFLAGLVNLPGGSVEAGRALVQPHPGLPDDTFLAGDSRAFTFYEKNPPIVVSAVDIARGGLDEAVHGYYATVVNDAGALLKIASS